MSYITQLLHINISMMSDTCRNRIVHAAAVFACILWASAFLGGKYALLYLPPLHLAGYRLIIASGILLLVIRKNPFKALKGRMGLVWVLSILQTVIVFSAFTLGLDLVPGSFGAIIIGSSPAVTALVAVLLLQDERMTPRKVIGLVIGMTGIVILTLSRQPWTAAGKQALAGVALLMFCNVSSACGSVLVKKHFKGISPLTVNTAQTILGAGIVMLLALLFEPMEPVAITPKLAGSVIYLAIVTSVAVSLWMTIISQPQIKISTITIWKFLIPSLGAVLSWLFTDGDEPSLLMILVIIAIVIAIIFTVTGAESESGKRNNIAA